MLAQLYIVVRILEAMALQVSYRYKTQVTEESQRRLEGIKVKRKFPAKIPVSNGLSCSCLYCVVYLCGLVGGGASDKLCHHELKSDCPP